MDLSSGALILVIGLTSFILF